MNAQLPIRAESGLRPIHNSRLQGRAIANAEDAELWRWFSLLVHDSRIRWIHAHEGWLVSIDHRHVATESSFDEAMRSAMLRFKERSGHQQTKF